MSTTPTPSERWEKTAMELRACRESQRHAWGEIDNAAIGRFLAGEATEEERAQLNQQLEKHPELGKIIDLVEDVLVDSGVVDGGALAKQESSVGAQLDEELIGVPAFLQMSASSTAKSEEDRPEHDVPIHEKSRTARRFRILKWMALGAGAVAAAVLIWIIPELLRTVLSGKPTPHEALANLKQYEKKLGIDYEQAIAKYRQFLLDFPDAKPELRSAVQKKITVELPKRIRQRDTLLAYIKANTATYAEIQAFSKKLAKADPSKIPGLSERAKIQDVTKKIFKLLETQDDAAKRERLVFTLAQICSAVPRASEFGVIDVLKKHLTGDGDEKVRHNCAFALGQLKDQAASAMPALEKASRDPSAAVRQKVAWALGKIGKGLYDSNDLPGAIDGYRKALAIDKQYVAAWNNLGLALYASKEWARAIDAYKKALAIDPRYAAAWNNLGVALRASKDLFSAIDAHEKALALNKQYAAAWYDLGVSLAENKNLPAAINAYNKALAIDNHYATAWDNIGDVAYEAAMPILSAMLQTGNIELKRKAAESLGKIGPPAKSAVPLLVKALEEPDVQLRRNAVTALGGIGKDAKDAAGALVAVVADSREKADVRSEAAVALRYIGRCQAAKDGIPALVRVLDDKSNPFKVRAYVLWALRVHREDLRDQELVMDALQRIVAKERKIRANKMLRYDAAYMLGMLKENNASDAAMKTLQEFILDDDALIYTGTTFVGSGGTVAKKNGKSGGWKGGASDGRVMAIQALSRVGAEKIRAYPKIVSQLRALANSPKTDPHLKRLTKKVLSDLGL